VAGEERKPNGPNKKTNQKKKTAGVAKQTSQAEIVKKASQAGVVKELLKKVEKKLSDDDVKATLGDYIRLVQLQKELDEEEPKEIKVTWVEPEKTESDSGE